MVDILSLTVFKKGIKIFKISYNEEDNDIS